jgi:hypothetical protein
MTLLATRSPQNHPRYDSVGSRAPAREVGGHRFKSSWDHSYVGVDGQGKAAGRLREDTASKYIAVR